MDIRFANDASINDYYMKSALGVGAIAAAGDKFLFGEPSLYKSLMFGGAVALGTYAGPDAALLDLRLKQFGGSAVSAFLVNNLVLNKNFQFSQLAVVAGSYLAKEGILTAINSSAHNSKHKK